MKGQYLKILLLTICLCEKDVICKDVITKISTKTSTIPGSGMDSDFSFFGLDTGGGFEMRLCWGQAGCCQTGELNTEENNWELGRVFTNSKIRRITEYGTGSSSSDFCLDSIINSHKEVW